MRFQSSIVTYVSLATSIISAYALPYEQAQETLSIHPTFAGDRNLSTALFTSLEELSRIVDVSYCVGVTGIYHPFQCASRCHEFPHFELIDTWNTGPLMSDSCGYIAIDHGHNGGKLGGGRIIVAFRGTYSLANTIVDLSTVPQEYVPYPTDPDEPANPPPADSKRSLGDYMSWPLRRSLPTTLDAEGDKEEKCTNCTVHTGFYTSYTHTRPLVIPHLENLKKTYPNYQLHLVGHSLGGAVAALMGLECESKEWNPIITTFGEPRVGNKALNKFLDKKFGLGQNTTLQLQGRYRRVTHVDDPVPLLPLREWGYRMHAGEVYISKAELSPTITDLERCRGDEDNKCIAGAEGGSDESLDGKSLIEILKADIMRTNEDEGNENVLEARWGFPTRFKLWQLFFAHRDYFWRLGLCVPGGDPLNWGREKYPYSDSDGNEEL